MSSFLNKPKDVAYGQNGSFGASLSGSMEAKTQASTADGSQPSFTFGAIPGILKSSQSAGNHGIMPSQLSNSILSATVMSRVIVLFGALYCFHSTRFCWLFLF